VMHIFRRFNSVGTTVLVASHDLHLLEHFDLRRVRLEGGRIAGDTPSTENVALLDPARLIDSVPGTSIPGTST
jgi:cell division transport system ATP-binding protein